MASLPHEPGAPGGTLELLRDAGDDVPRLRLEHRGRVYVERVRAVRSGQAAVVGFHLAWREVGDMLRAASLHATRHAVLADLRRAGAALDAAVAGSEVVLDGSDNFVTRAAVNAACIAHRRPLVSGAALRWEGRLAVFDLRSAASPCLACLHPDTRESLENCERGGVLGPLVGVIGSLQAVEALKLLTGTGIPLTGRLLRYDARNGRITVFAIDRRPDCPACRNRPAA